MNAVASEYLENFHEIFIMPFKDYLWTKRAFENWNIYVEFYLRYYTIIVDTSAFHICIFAYRMLYIIYFKSFFNDIFSTIKIVVF